MALPLNGSEDDWEDEDWEDEDWEDEDWEDDDWEDEDWEDVGSSFGTVVRRLSLDGDVTW